MYEIDYVDFEGRVWPLHGRGRRHGVIVLEDGVSGLVGEAKDSVVEPVGAPGQLFDSVEVQAVEGELKCILVPHGETVGELFSRWRAAWSRRKCGTLQIRQRDLGASTWSLQVRLAEGMDLPEVDPQGMAPCEVSVRVVGDGGVWLSDEARAAGTVTVANFGDVPVWPSVVWKGAGGKVTLPSGATFTLPAATDRRVMHLDPAESLVVTDMNGVVDRDLWLKVASTGWAEPVMPDKTATFTVPKGAELAWHVGVLDPFGGV